ncbi:MAG: glycosyltransferase family 2 protein [Parcubacteria group bacterium]|jgi:cellulose synthase/poly-beta-1,6-N-acetylglucosamine synthase-like glycosyltransferase
MIKYSFIIPVKAINDYIRESIPKILEIPREDYEIIIYPDELDGQNYAWAKTRIIATGTGGPAMKRSLAIRDAQGELLVFVDDDAYPEKNILEFLDEDFQDAEIAAVGGPAITPKSDSFLQKVSGAIYLSILGGNFPERYCPIGKARNVSDWPTVNLTVRKAAFTEVGGFSSNYWPGEDTKLCLDLVNNKENNKILYDPRIIVWHHRREGLWRHLKQVAGYGLHRGFFAKKFPETSCKLRYFIPSGFFAFALVGWVPILFFSGWYLELYLVGWLVYCLALLKVFWDVIRRQRELDVALYSLVYVFFTHITYGLRFIQGFVFTRELKSKLR